MTKRQFLLGIFILITIVGIGGVGGYFAIESRKIHREEQRIQADVEKYKADKKTERTKERWSFLPKLRDDD